MQLPHCEGQAGEFARPLQAGRRELKGFVRPFEPRNTVLAEMVLKEDLDRFRIRNGGQRGAVVFRAPSQQSCNQRRRARLAWSDRFFWVALSRAWLHWRAILLVVKANSSVPKLRRSTASLGGSRT
jgi:hypothetical protein